jgi:hypothetical protein
LFSCNLTSPRRGCFIKSHSYLHFFHLTASYVIWEIWLILETAENWKDQNPGILAPGLDPSTRVCCPLKNHWLLTQKDRGGRGGARQVVEENFSLVPTDKEIKKKKKHCIYTFWPMHFPFLSRQILSLFSKRHYGVLVFWKACGQCLGLSVLIIGWLAVLPGAWHYNCSMPQ